jgi:hypothetical protein
VKSHRINGPNVLVCSHNPKGPYFKSNPQPSLYLHSDRNDLLSRSFLSCCQAARDRLNSVVRVVQTGPPAPLTRITDLVNDAFPPAPYSYKSAVGQTAVGKPGGTCSFSNNNYLDRTVLASVVSPFLCKLMKTIELFLGTRSALVQIRTQV